MEEIATAIGALALGLVQIVIHALAGVFSASIFVTRRKGWDVFWSQTTRVPEMEVRHCTSVLDRLPSGWSDRLEGIAARVQDNPTGITFRIEHCIDRLPDEAP